MLPPFNLTQYVMELLRPWKLVSFSMALGYYIWGAVRYQCPTWDIPVSIIMSVLTYVFAPWTVDSIYYLFLRRPRRWGFGLLLCLAIIYVCASGSYELYNLWNLGYWPPPTYWVNLYYSSLMFFAAGMLWRFQGSLKMLWDAIISGSRVP